MEENAQQKAEKIEKAKMEEEQRRQQAVEFNIKTEEMESKAAEERKKQEERKKLSQQIAAQQLSTEKPADKPVEKPLEKSVEKLEEKPSIPQSTVDKPKPVAQASPVKKDETPKKVEPKPAPKPTASPATRKSGSISRSSSSKGAIDPFTGMPIGGSTPVVPTKTIKIKDDPYLIYIDPDSSMVILIGKLILIDKVMTYKLCIDATNIGRKKGDNDMVINSKCIKGIEWLCFILSDISRMHARVDLENDELTLKDLGSSSGTKVNGKMIAEHKLKKGDQIKLGKTLIVLSGLQFGACKLCVDKSDSLLGEGGKEGSGFKQSTAFLKSWQSRHFCASGQVLYYWKTLKDVSQLLMWNSQTAAKNRFTVRYGRYGRCQH